MKAPSGFNSAHLPNKGFQNPIQGILICKRCEYDSRSINYLGINPPTYERIKTDKQECVMEGINDITPEKSRIE